MSAICMTSAQGKLSKSITILMADDDPGDREIMRKVIYEYHMEIDFKCVRDGVELLDYLNHRGEFVDTSLYPRPDLILLDLNMPRMGGAEVLERIKSDSKLCDIPIVILSTSEAQRDVMQTYQSRANAYVVKPLTFDELADTVRAMGRFWSKTAQLPSKSKSSNRAA